MLRLRLAFAQPAVLVIPMVATGLFVPSIAFSQENPPAAAQDAPAEEETAKAFIVPEGKDPEVLQSFLNQLMRTPAQERTRSGFRDHLTKLHDLSQEVFQRDVDDETNLLAISVMSGSLEFLEQFGDQTAGERKIALINSLKASKRPALAARGRMLEIQTEITGLDLNDKAAVKTMIGRVNQYLQEQPLTLDHGRIAYGAFSALEQLGEPELIASAAQTFAKPLRASDDPTLKGLADTLEGSARRLTLKGNAPKIAGPTVSGEDFNIEQWKGKVVIVDFWATWCGPCIEELPNLKALYDTHHAHGLEIVGVSLDDSRPQLEAFLKDRKLPWPTVFIDPEGKEGWENPLATYYGISSIPTMFLVGRDGKVVATELYGDALSDMVAELVAKPAP
ncbi:MAG: TlpA family protein disulfide reductase [Planctomycetaceae bacterium]|nr:TlpA family protein disulfide reductase [Planctomycetaceae bacterium]